MNLARRVVSEMVGTALLLAAVVGSGIMAERLAGGNVAVGEYNCDCRCFGSFDSYIRRDLGGSFQPGRYDRTFAGIRPADVPAFMIAQFIGAFAATALFRWLVPITAAEAEDVVMPHEETKR